MLRFQTVMKASFLRFGRAYVPDLWGIPGPHLSARKTFMSESKRPKSRQRHRRLSFESLEMRRVMASLPFGATPADTGEFMLGRIAVTPILLESDGSTDLNTENWNSAHVASVMNNLQEGLDWWKQLLATKSSVHTIDWVIDRTFVDNRPSTPYEPINRVSNAYELWVDKFLDDTGYKTTFDLEQNLRNFNQAQREKMNTDWSFTIFVVNSQNDRDGTFAIGGTFSRAFAFAGGLFMVVPSVRPASTFAHETGHIFWAKDEYTGGSSYSDRRGYYDAQNTNATDGNPDPNFQQQPSIMSAGSVLEQAYAQVVSPSATLAMIGWRDSDSDGIFDVLDVPLALEGTGRLNPTTNSYAFRGTATVQTLPNRNSSGLQNNITLNRIGRIEYRIGNGAWISLSTPNKPTVDLDLQIPVSILDVGRTIEIRAIDPRIGIVSNTFSGVIGGMADTTTRHGIQGFVWQDGDQSRGWDASEVGLPGANLRLLDTNRQPIDLQRILDPDAYPEGILPGNLGGVRIDTIGLDAIGTIGVFDDLAASTGSKIFKPYSFWAKRFVDSFHDQDQQLRARFDVPTSYVSIDAIAFTDNSSVRLDAYAADGTIVAQFERKGMLRNDRVTMEVGTGEARIAYVIARGFQNSYIKLDNLRFGPKASARTSVDGSYFLENIPAGNYLVEVISPVAGAIPTNTLDGTLTVAYGAQRSVTHVDFGLYLEPSPWQNPNLPEDVNGLDGVNPIDVLLLINDINQYGTRSLIGSPIQPPPYLDVDGDRNIGPLDVLRVINYINSMTSSSSSGRGGEGEFAAPPIEIASLHPTENPPLRSFATERLETAPTTWIVDRTGSAALRPQGPERCGCPACVNWCEAMDEGTGPVVANAIVGLTPDLSAPELDAYFAAWDD